MLGILQALVLGLVQGATEYLPVSSSGHLVIAQHLFGLEEPVLFFDIVLHLGTLLAVVFYYRKDILEIVLETLGGLRDLWARQRPSEVLAKRPGFQLGLLIVLGSIPTAILGLAFEETFERLFGSVRWVGFMLMATGVVLVLTRLTDGGEKGRTMPTWKDALIIGFVQGLAITPGISRSGSTIAAALFLGLERSQAARYSFLLSLPSIIGALILKIGDSGDSVGTLALMVGFTSAAISGYFCLVLLLSLVKKGRFSWFAPYCFAMGLAAVLLAS